MADLLIVNRIQRPSGDNAIWGPDNRQLTPAEVSAMATMYWGIFESPRVVAVATCESGLWTGAWAVTNEDSRGLLQLNVQAHPELLLYNLFDPQINLYWAYQLWNKEGWQPWTCAHKLGIV